MKKGKGEKMKKISIIVPIYNAEKYISKCLDSILMQAKENVELILINDGSTDRSEEIIGTYLGKYKTSIKYIKQTNQGIATTRNIGIEKATGDYIIFVDSDDYIDKDLLKKLEPYMEQEIDIIKYKAILETEQEEEIGQFEGPIFDVVTGQEAFSKLCFTDEMLDALWVYAYKRALFIKNKLKFIKNVDHEDFGLIPLIILKANTFISTDIQGYHYVQSENSITRNSSYEKTVKKVFDTLTHYDNMIKQIENYKISKEAKENVKIFYTNSILLRINQLEKKERKKFIKEIRKRKMTKNIKVRNAKQLLKRILLEINIPLYLKIR